MWPDKARWPGRWDGSPTALTAVVVLVQPVVAAALGWVIFGEALTPLQGCGGLQWRWVG